MMDTEGTAVPENTKRKDITGRWVLFATISASSMAFIDGSALNVALPALQQDLGATGADLLWILNAYALLLAALLLVGGSLGDNFGRKRIYSIGILIFSASSLVCGLAPSTEILILARGVQGIGGALMIPGSLALISAYFDDSRRGMAIGIWSSFTTMTSILGPVMGGFLAENGLWRGVFLINLPLAAIALYALMRYVPESRDEAASRTLDVIGAIWAVVGLAGITFGFIELGRLGPEIGLSSPAVILSLIIGVSGLIAFVVYEGRAPHPMMPLRLFRSRTFSGANLLTLFLYGALGGALVFLPLNLVQVQGYGETIAGLSMLPFSILLLLLSPWAGRLVDKYGPRPPLIVGPVIVTIAFLLLANIGVTGGPSDYWTTFFPATIVFGAGMGITVAPLTTTVMGSVPQHNAGIASGVNNAMSRSSQVLANAVMGGLALLIFSQALTARTEPFDLPDDSRVQLSERAVDLGATTAPDDLPDSLQAEVDGAVHLAFVDMFRVVMLIAAGMSAFSAILAGLLIEQQLRSNTGTA